MAEAPLDCVEYITIALFFKGSTISNAVGNVVLALLAHAQNKCKRVFGAAALSQQSKHKIDGVRALLPTTLPVEAPLIGLPVPHIHHQES